MNGWFDSSKGKLTKDAIRRHLEGKPPGAYSGGFLVYKDDNGDIEIKSFDVWERKGLLGRMYVEEAQNTSM